VNARLLVDTQRGVTLLPTAAIQRNAQGTFIYVISSDNTANLRNVTVGTTDANMAAVQGVNAGEVVAVNGFDKLQNGGKVTINNKNAGGGNGGNNGTSANGSSTNNNGANKNGNAPPTPNTHSNTGGGTHP
jgi:multidrug efflux system membrane fusion protein